MRGELETEQNCNILTPTLMAISAFLSRSPRMLNRGPGGPASLGHVPHSSIFSPTDLTSCLHPGYIIVRHHLLLVGVTNCTQFNLSTVKVISWYSSTGCTCYLHRCISYLDRLAGVNMLHHKTALSLENDYIFLFFPDGPLQGTKLVFRVDLEVKVIKRYLTFFKASKLMSQHQMKFRFIPRTLVLF